MAAALRKKILILAFRDLKTRSRSLFKALHMICIQKYTSISLQNLEIHCEEEIRCEESEPIKCCVIIIHTS